MDGHPPAAGAAGGGHPATAAVAVAAEFQRHEVTWAQAVPQALVLAPTRELVQQIAAEATRLAHGSAIQVAVVYGGSPKAEQVCHRPASRARPGDPRLWRGARGTMFSSCWRYASPA
jgi:hypothetical protein